MAKKHTPIYEIIDILRATLTYNLAKYQYFSIAIRPGLFDNYYQISYSLQFSVQYQVKCGFYVQKTFKKGPKCHFLNSCFIESAHYVLIYNLGYDKYFSIITLFGKYFAEILPNIFGGLTQKSSSFSICGISLCNPL